VSGASDERPTRLFVAVEVPEPVRSALDTAVEPWRARVPRARWTCPGSWHVTLTFLGWTPPDRRSVVEDGVAQTAREWDGFETRLTALGAFPSAGRARVLWVGLEDPAERLAGMAAALGERFGPWFEPERRAFTPHLTLARIDPPANLATSAPGLLDLPVRSAPFRADELVLYRSHLSPRGARYEALLRASLRA
jgi:RNA 2',3'-cyclic 3'-phosphodiesterase